VLTDVSGVRVGHWTDSEAATGCTVVLLPPGVVASGEVRGGAPASREFALLDPGRTVGEIDAVVLSGGSAFGLAAADGVMSGLEADGRGYETRHGRVPIVVGLSLFDLGVGDGSVRPGPTEGAAAYRAAVDSPPGRHDIGLVGAGAGATVNKWFGDPIPGGIGTASVVVDVAVGDQPADVKSADGGEREQATLVVAALVAVNAVGAIDDGTFDGVIPPPVRPPAEGENTTIGVVVTNAVIDKTQCHLLAQGAHDGLARSLLPAHTAADGDAIVVAATGELGRQTDAEANVDPMYLKALVEGVVCRAVRSLI
jgi:L-aminopeptidase/D-esterase-like protein